VGMDVILLASCGAIVVHSQTGALGHLGNALAAGLAVMVMIAVAGNPREHAQTTSTMQWSVRTRARFLK
jgi:hypothetical protein